MRAGGFRQRARLFFHKWACLWLLAGLTALSLLLIGWGSAIAAAWLSHQLVLEG